MNLPKQLFWNLNSVILISVWKVCIDFCLIFFSASNSGAFEWVRLILEDCLCPNMVEPIWLWSKLSEVRIEQGDRGQSNFHKPEENCFDRQGKLRLACLSAAISSFNDQKSWVVEQSTLNHQSQTKYCCWKRVPLGQRKENLVRPDWPSLEQMWKACKIKPWIKRGFPDVYWQHIFHNKLDLRHFCYSGTPYLALCLWVSIVSSVHLTIAGERSLRWNGIYGIILSWSARDCVL